MTVSVTTELAASDRWKAELFFESDVADLGTAHDIVQIGDLLSVRKEALDPQAYSDHLFNYVGLEHVASRTGDLVGFAPRLGADVRSRSKVFYADDILYGRLRANLNKVYLAEPPVAEGICSGEFYVLVPDRDAVVPRFLRAALASEFVQAHVGRFQGGSALPRLPLDDLLGLSVPVPPLEEQERIARALHDLDVQRRQLAFEVTLLPEVASASLVGALESGEPFAVGDLPNWEPPLAADGLPDDYVPKVRGRGRPRQSDGPALFNFRTISR